MKRQSNKRPDVILCADIHLREDTPVCRNDNFQRAQWEKLQFIKDLQRKHDCPVFHAGDLFHHWKPSPWLLSKAIEHLPDEFITVYGNHDLPQHNIELKRKCGIYTLASAGVLKTLTGCHWGKQPTDMVNHINVMGKRVLVWHVFTYEGKAPFPGITSQKGHALLAKHPTYDLIVTGDNHTPFTVTDGKRVLVNPGSMMRTTADQIDHRPRVYLWYAGEARVEPVYLPIAEDVISREHIDRQEQRNKRIDAFISRLDEDWEAELAFEENLKRFAAKNRVRDTVMEIVYKSIES